MSAKRGRPRGPDYGLDPTTRRRRRRHRAAFRARLAVLVDALVAGCGVEDSLTLARLTWNILGKTFRHDPTAADLYRRALVARDTDHAALTPDRALRSIAAAEHNRLQRLATLARDTGHPAAADTLLRLDAELDAQLAISRASAPRNTKRESVR